EAGDKLGSALRKTIIERFDNAAIGLVQGLYARVARSPGGEHSWRLVRRTIIDRQDADVRNSLVRHARECGIESRRGIVYGNQDVDQGRWHEMRPVQHEAGYPRNPACLRSTSAANRLAPPSPKLSNFLTI